MSEAKVVKACVNWAKEQGYWARKIVYPGRRGAKDYIFAKDGVVFFVEFKKEGKKQEPLQAYEHQLMRQAGLDVWGCDNFHAFEARVLRKEREQWV